MQRVLRHSGSACLYLHCPSALTPAWKPAQCQYVHVMTIPPLSGANARLHVARSVAIHADRHVSMPRPREDQDRINAGKEAPLPAFHHYCRRMGCGLFPTAAVYLPCSRLGSVEGVSPSHPVSTAVLSRRLRFLRFSTTSHVVVVTGHETHANPSALRRSLTTVDHAHFTSDALPVIGSFLRSAP